MRQLLISSFLMLVSCGSIAVSAVNLALDSPYELDPAPNYDLTNDEGDVRQLTDGHYVDRYFWSSPEAVGWKNAGLIKIEIDLGSVQRIARVCVNTARGDHAEVSFPSSIYIFSSFDKQKYHNLGDLYQGELHERGAYLVKKFCASNLATDGRYLLLAIKPQGGFTFVDEIEVFAAGESKKNRPDVIASIDRGDIRASLESHHVFKNHMAGVRKQAYRLTQDKTTTSSNRLKSILAKLSTDQVADHSRLNELTLELLALSRFALLDDFKAPLIVWYKNPWAVFSPFDKPTPDDVIGDALEFDLLRHGHASSAFVLTNNTVKQQGYEIKARFKAGNGVPSIQLREVVSVFASNHESVGDALTPIENGLVFIQPGESKQIWLTVSSALANAGQYLGEVLIKNRDNDSQINPVPLRINIWPAAMPDESQRVFVNTWAYLNWTPIQNIPTIAVQDLRAHHVNVAAMRASQIPWPRFYRGIQMSPDYRRFDETLAYQSESRMRLFFFHFNHPERRTFGHRFAFKTPAWKRAVKTWIADWASHLKALGLSYEDFAFYPVDEPKNSDEMSYLLETARLVKEVDPRLAVYTTLGKLSVIDLFLLEDVVDIYQVHLSGLNSLSALALKAAGKPVWSYSASGGKAASPLGYYRAQAWRAFQWGATGLGVWAYADAGNTGTAWNDFDGRRPDYSLIYEGDGLVISSKRWEAWREGVEDYELLLLTKKKLRPSEVAEFNAVIRGVLDNAENPRQLEEARHYLLSVSSRQE